MTRLAAAVVLLTLGLVALAWHAIAVLDRLLGGDGPTIGLTPQHRQLLDEEPW